MWIDPGTVDSDQVLYNEGGYVNGMGLRLSDGSLEAIVQNNGEPGTIAAPYDGSGWTHVAVVFDQGALRLYVDGEEIAANEDIGFDIVPGHVAGSELGGNATTTPWEYSDGAAPFFDGNIDATAVYRSALSPAEIRTVADRSFSVDAPTFYATGSSAEAFSVTATFSDLPGGDTAFEGLSMSLAELPDGWDASAETATEFDSVADGGSVAATWEVTPDPDTTGAVELEAAVEFDADGERERLADGAALGTLDSAALAQWPFDGSPADASGNGHAATLENGASFDDSVAVQGSHSVLLDGDDDYVDLADGGTPYISEGFSARTISMWIRPDSTSGSQVLFNSGGAVNGLGVRINDEAIEARAINSRSGPTISAPFSATEWTHVAVVFDSGALRLYVDGEEAAANEDVGFTAVGSAYWGGELGGSERFPWSGTFDGHVDLSTVYPFALSPELVSTLAGSY